MFYCASDVIILKLCAILSVMYLRIQIPEADRVYYRFLWRSCKEDRDPEEYEFNRVVVGMTSSSVQAQFVIQKHAELYKSEYSMASKIALKSDCIINLHLSGTKQVCMPLSCSPILQKFSLQFQ